MKNLRWIGTSFSCRTTGAQLLCAIWNLIYQSETNRFNYNVGSSSEFSKHSVKLTTNSTNETTAHSCSTLHVNSTNTNRIYLSQQRNNKVMWPTCGTESAGGGFSWRHIPCSTGCGGGGAVSTAGIALGAWWTTTGSYKVKLNFRWWIIFNNWQVRL